MYILSLDAPRHLSFLQVYAAASTSARTKSETLLSVELYFGIYIKFPHSIGLHGASHLQAKVLKGASFPTRSDQAAAGRMCNGAQLLGYFALQ